MYEREKIINIIQSVKYCEANNSCDKCKYDKELDNYKDMSCGTLKAADALIAANIGDVTVWKARAENAERNDKIKDRALYLLAKAFVELKGYYKFESAQLAKEITIPEFLQQAESEIDVEKND